MVQHVGDTHSIKPYCHILAAHIGKMGPSLLAENRALRFNLGVDVAVTQAKEPLDARLSFADYQTKGPKPDAPLGSGRARTTHYHALSRKDMTTLQPHFVATLTGAPGGHI